MRKYIILIMSLLLLSATGCRASKAASVSENKQDEIAVKSSTDPKPSTIDAAPVETSAPAAPAIPAASNEVKGEAKDIDSAWKGFWSESDQPTSGSEMTIEHVYADKLEFSFSTFFVRMITGQDGKEYPNYHEGQVTGEAYFISPTEAVYTTTEAPNYKMTLTLRDGKVIEVKEINTETQQDYGSSPYAGVNTRFRGTYSKK